MNCMCAHCISPILIDVNRGLLVSLTLDRKKFEHLDVYLHMYCIQLFITVDTTPDQIPFFAWKLFLYRYFALSCF